MLRWWSTKNGETLVVYEDLAVTPDLFCHAGRENKYKDVKIS